MKLELQVIASTAIKRKKPWPKLAWIGETQESIFLIDQKRLSVLYIPSGKTKRKITLLQPLLPEVSALNYSKNGHYVVGVCQSGDLFLWHKDTNTLVHLAGLPVFCLASQTSGEAGKLHVYVSNTGHEILVAPPGGAQVYLWQRGQDVSPHTPAVSEVPGTWMLVQPPSNVAVPTPSNTELAVSAVFMLDEVLGRACSCSFIFSEGPHIVITSVLLKWSVVDGVPSAGHSVQSDWTCMRYWHPGYPLDAPAIRIPGALLPQHSHDGHLVAVAVNQPCSHDNRMLFVSTLTDNVVVSDMKGCGARHPVSGRPARVYWMVDMMWTWDDLFLVCVIGQGSVCMLTRMGEPVVLQSYGHRLEMGPSMFLPLHPLVSIPGLEQQQDPLKQRYSVCPHPRLPLILVSDGYLVTVLQLPGEMTCLSMVTGLAMEAATHLRHIRDKQHLSVNLDDHPVAGSRTSMPSSSARLQYVFEQPEEDALDKTLDNDIADLVKPLAGSALPEQGKIIFGGDEGLSFEDAEQHAQASMSVALELEKAYRCISLAWSLAASHTGVWTEHHEDAMKLLVHHTCKLLSIILVSDSKVIKQLPTTYKATKNMGIFYTLTLVRRILSLLKMDGSSGNLLVVALHMTHQLLQLFLRPPKAKENRRLEAFQGCYILLTYIERTLLHIYWPSRTQHSIGRLTNCEDVFQSSLHHAYSAALSDQEGADSAAQNGARVTYVVVRQDTQETPGTPIERSQSLAQLSTRLGLTWRLLHQQVVKHWRETQVKKRDRKNTVGLQYIMNALQCKLQLYGTSIGSKKKCKIEPGKRLAIEGSSVPATQTWLQQLNKFKAIPEKQLERILHSVLYTLLLQYDLRHAVEFVEILIRQDDIQSAAALFRQDQQTKISVLSLVHQKHPPEELDPPPSYIQSLPVLQLVRSLGRFMAAYFANSTIFVHPPHTAHRLPSVHLQHPIKQRIIPVYSEDVSSVIRKSGLSHVWTVERCVEYLLATGLLSEAIWLALRLGDWKTAFVIASVTHQRTEWLREHGFTDDIIKMMELPEELSAAVILKQQLQAALIDSPSSDAEETGNKKLDPFISSEAGELRCYIGDMLLASTMMGVCLTPWLLDSLIARAKSVMQQLSSLVPDGFYLPAPPLYCPQPAQLSQARLSSEVTKEIQLRLQLSHILQYTLLTLSASQCLLPAARWYLTRVLQAIHIISTAKKRHFDFQSEDTAFLSGFLDDVSSPFQGEENEPSIHDILAAFRDVCSLFWLLHVRDRLSLSLRKKLRKAESQMKREETVEQAAWEAQCMECLAWVSHMSVFSDFLSGQVAIYSTLLSVIMELPPTEEVAAKVALLLPDMDSLAPELQDKLEVLLKGWQGVVLQGQHQRGSIKLEGLPGKSPRGRTLSVIYLKQTKKVQQKLRNRQKMFGLYEPQVFASTEKSQGIQDGISFIGARPFESDKDFLYFLDMFYAVCLHKEMEKLNQKNVSSPLLDIFKDDLRSQELNSIAHKAVTSMKKKHNAGQYQDSFRLPMQYQKIDDMSYSSHPPKSPGRHQGLFRSRSFTDVSSEWNQKSRGPLMGLVVENRSASYSALHTLDLETHTRTPREHYKVKLRSKSVAGTPKKELVTHVSVPLQRSPSVESQVSQEDKGADPLAEPLFSSQMLNAMVFGPKYQQTESLVEWLINWSCKQHKINPDSGARPAMHISIPSRLVIYALWEIEHFYYPRWGPSRPIQVDDTTTRGTSSAMSEATMPDTADRFRKPPKSPRENRNLNNNDSIHNNNIPEPTGNDHPDFTEESDPQPAQRKPKKKKSEKKNKKLSFQLEPANYERDTNSSEDTVEKKPNRKLFETSDPPKEEKNPIISNTSESSLNVSSLYDEDLVKEPLIQPKEAVPEGGPVMPTPRTPLKQERAADKERNGGPEDLASMDLANTLRDIIRREMTRVMKAQYEGIMSGLGSLDEEGPPPSSTRKSSRKTPQKHQTPRDKHKAAHVIHDDYDGRSSTEFDITPLPSDDPLSLSELEKPSPLKKKAQEQAGMHLDGALHELRHLEPHSSRYLSPGGALSYTYGTSQQTVVPVPQTQAPNHRQPYHRVFHVLSDVNQKMQVSFNHPPLLRMPPPSQSTSLPYIPLARPRMAWQEVRSVSSVPQMPYMQHTAYPVDEVPVRDTAALPGMRLAFTPSTSSAALPGAGFFSQPNNSARFPLLHLPGRHRMFSHIEDQNGVPRLVPPEELAAFERQRLKQAAKQQRQQEELRQKISQIEPKAADQSSNSEDLDTTKQQDIKDEGPATVRSGVQVQSHPRADGASIQQVEAQQPQDAEEDVDDESVEIHPGHALTPGLFDEYLDKPEDPANEYLMKETFAEVQLSVASKLKASRTKAVARDTAIQTDPTLVHTGTTYSKEAGTDPVQEAIESYIRARRNLGAGGLLPPDIFMGLKFTDSAEAPASEKEGRAFINVVDLEGEAVDSIVAHISGRKDPPQSGLLQPAYRDQPARDHGPSHQPPTKPTATNSDAEEIFVGPDAVTKRLLGQPPPPLSLDKNEVAGKARMRTKSSIHGRLEDMGVQIDAIENMAQRMQDDYKNTKLLLHTIEHLGEAIDPSDRVAVTAKVLQPPSHSPPTKDVTVTSKPSSGQPPSEDKKEPSARSLGEDIQQRAVKQKDKVTPEQRLQALRANLAMKPANKSVEHGLDVTDDIAFADVHGTNEGHIRDSVRSSGNHMSRVELLEMLAKTTDKLDRSGEDSQQQKRSEEEKRQLQEYIAKKRAERMREFRLKRDALREREVRPFQTTADSSKMSTRDLEDMESQRVKNKQTRELEYAEQRCEMANRMMQDMLDDQLHLPPEPEVSPVKSSSKPHRQSQSPSRRRPSGTVIHRGPKHSSPIRAYDPDSVDVNMDDYAHVRASHDFSALQRDQRVRWSDEMLAHTATESFTGAYTQQLEQMQTDTWDSERSHAAKRSPIPEESEPPQPRQQPKPFTELVRMRRPEMTRQQPGYKRKPVTYTERLSQLSGSHTPRSQKENDKEYGMKQSGTATVTVRRAPRTVKTYTQRLQDMKQARQAAEPISWQPRTGPLRQNIPGRPIRPTLKRRKPKKPLTYAEQLQKLQPPKELYRTGDANMLSTSMRFRPVKRSHKPPHKPKTYAQQLQELQPPKTYGLPETTATNRFMEPPVFRTSFNRGLMRSRPYRDPYEKAEAEDDNSSTSVVSGWNLDDNMRKIIYDDETSNLERMSVATTGADMSDITELDQLLGDGYTSMVSIQDLAEIKSVSSGSIMSFIDWDQVENLIADV